MSVEGDVDVSQRKGKVITIFDVQIKLEYTGARFPYEPSYFPRPSPPSIRRLDL